MAAAPPQGGGSSQPLNNCQTWVLKVSIHCEGCKKKVKKILSSVQGVYNIDIDAKQHRVIVTGDVDANTLLKRLEKSGKHAELWPDFRQYPPTKPKKMKEPSSQEQGQKSQNKNPTVEGEKVTANAEEKTQKNADAEISKSGGDNATDNTSKVEVKEETTPAAANETKQPPEENPGEDSGVGKKKKKKGHKGNITTAATTTTYHNNNNNNNSDNEAPPSRSAPPRADSPPPSSSQARYVPGPYPDSMGPPPPYAGMKQAYEYPPAYYAPPPPQPVYGVSYNTAYPSYAASYYSAPPPYSYAYVQGADVGPPPPSDWNAASSQPADSFQMFSDENPNACSLM